MRGATGAWCGRSRSTGAPVATTDCWRGFSHQHADAVAVVPNALAVAAPYVINGTAPCGCRPGVENQPPTKTMRRSVRDYMLIWCGLPARAATPTTRQRAG